MCLRNVCDLSFESTLAIPSFLYGRKPCDLREASMISVCLLFSLAIENSGSSQIASTFIMRSNNSNDLGLDISKGLVRRMCLSNVSDLSFESARAVNFFLHDICYIYLYYNKFIFIFFYFIYPPFF